MLPKKKKVVTIDVSHFKEAELAQMSKHDRSKTLGPMKADELT